jgi:hypothetical protein
MTRIHIHIAYIAFSAARYENFPARTLPRFKEKHLPPPCCGAGRTKQARRTRTDNDKIKFAGTIQ